jgi:hypothetical protein
MNVRRSGTQSGLPMKLYGGDTGVAGGGTSPGASLA